MKLSPEDKKLLQQNAKSNKEAVKREEKKLKADIGMQKRELALEERKALLQARAQREQLEFAREQEEKQAEKQRKLARKQDDEREGSLHALIGEMPLHEVEADARLSTIKLDLDNNVDINDEDEAYLHAKAQSFGVEQPVEDETTWHET